MTVVISVSHARIHGHEPVQQFLDEQNEISARCEQLRMLFSDELQEVEYAESHGRFK